MIELRMLAFMDEMEKIASQKQAGFMTDVGQTIKNTWRNPAQAAGSVAGSVGGMAADQVRGVVGGIGNWASRGGISRELHGAADSFMQNPLRSFRQGAIMKANRMSQGGALGIASHGLRAAQNIYGLTQKEDPTGQGRSRTARTAEFAGGELGRLVGLPHSMLGAHLTSEAGRKAGRLAGSVIDRVRNKGKPTPDEMQPPPQNELAQRVEKTE